MMMMMMLEITCVLFFFFLICYIGLNEPDDKMSEKDLKYV
jgi:hypothetical protein